MTVAEAIKLGVYDSSVMYREELEARVRPQVWDAVSRVGEDEKGTFTICHLIILRY